MSQLRNYSKHILTGLIFIFTLSACTQTSRITTKPEGAKIWINNTYFGQTPITYSTRSGTPQTLYVKITKKGFKTQEGIMIDKVYKADLSLLLLIPGIIPYFFSARLEDQYEFVLPEETE